MFAIGIQFLGVHAPVALKWKGCVCAESQVFEIQLYGFFDKVLWRAFAITIVGVCM